MDEETYYKMSKEEQKAYKKQLRANFKHGLKVGDILYSMWGYDQTNVDYYKIMGVKGKSVIIQQIKERTIEDGFMCGKTTPIINEVLGEPLKKIPQPSINDVLHGKEPRALVNLNSYSFAELWDGQPKSSSWYA